MARSLKDYIFGKAFTTAQKAYDFASNLDNYNNEEGHPYLWFIITGKYVPQSNYNTTYHVFAKLVDNKTFYLDKNYRELANMLRSTGYYVNARNEKDYAEFVIDTETGEVVHSDNIGLFNIRY